MHAPGVMVQQSFGFHAQAEIAGHDLPTGPIESGEETSMGVQEATHETAEI